jgi:hypothetical protein
MLLGKGEIDNINWSPDGKYLVVDSSVGFYLHDSDTLQQVEFIDSSGDLIFRPDGKPLIVERDTSTKLKDTTSGKDLATLPGINGDILYSHVLSFFY